MKMIGFFFIINQFKHERCRCTGCPKSKATKFINQKKTLFPYFWDTRYCWNNKEETADSSLEMSKMVPVPAGRGPGPKMTGPAHVYSSPVEPGICCFPLGSWCI